LAFITAVFVVIIIFLAILTIMKQNNEKITLSMGAIELYVNNLEITSDFYHQAIGLDIIDESDNYLGLGYNNKLLVKLYEKKQLSKAKPNDSGLYHMALVFEDRSHLANTLQKIFSHYPQLYQGSSDHIATEAFYFSDPEGNGVELYFDKPRSEWRFDDNGKPIMGSTYIDEKLYVNQYKSADSPNNNIVMGHIHLKVGNIDQAKNFYVNILNFEIMNQLPTALFISRDNYHHHLGMNIWESNGSDKRNKNTYGLKSYEIIFHDKNEFNKVLQNLKKNNITYDHKENIIEFDDPWNNTIILVLD
jgi:catechol 2,3-dioxygenase